MPNYLKEREESAAGNAEDSFNPGDQAYNQDMDSRFDALKRAEEDREFDDIIAANYGDEPPAGAKTDSHGDTVQRNFNADEPNPTENIDATKDAEEQGVGGKGLYNAASIASGGKIMGMLRGKGGKKMGPTGGIIGILLFAIVGLGGGSTSLAATILVNFKEIFHNDRSDGTRTNRLYSRAFLSNKMNNKNACTGSKIKCKVSGMSVKQMKEYIKRGFKISGTEVDADGKNTGKKIEDDTSLQPDDQKPKTTGTGAKETPTPDTVRGHITSIEFPTEVNGVARVKANNANEFFDHIAKSVSALRSAELAFPSKASFYNNKFFSKMISDKWHLSKAKQSFPDDKDKAKQNDAFDKQVQEDVDKKSTLGPDGKPLNDDKEGKRDYSSRASTLSGEADKKALPKEGGKTAAVGMVVQALCSIYKYSYALETSIKLYHISRLIPFAFIFLQAADEIKDGRGDMSKVAYLGDSLTSYESNKTMTTDTEYAKKGAPNPKYNLNASDSDGYKMAAHGDTAGLKAFAKRYTLGGGSVGKMGNVASNTNQYIGEIVGKMTGDSNPAANRKTMKTFCRFAGGKASQIAQNCIGATAGGSITAPGLGTILGVAMCGCALGSAANNNVAEICAKPFEALQPIIAKVAKWAAGELKITEELEKILQNLDVNSDTKGVDAGNAIAAGVGLMLSTSASGYGMTPSSQDGGHKDISSYITYTQPLEDTYIALDKADARDNPLDMTNQYSLIGSFARSLNVDLSAPRSLFGNLSLLTSVIPNAINTALTGTRASALYNQPSEAQDVKRYDSCNNDEDLNYISATGDKFCSIVGITSNSELNWASDQAYKTGNQNINNLVDFMTGELPSDMHDRKNSDQNCTKTDGTDTDGSGTENDCSKSEKSIEDEGKPIKDTQYDKYLQYCTDKREDPWGAQSAAYEQGTDRDQRWYAGTECMLNPDNPKTWVDGASQNEAKMVAKFREWTNICLQSGTADGTSNCYTEDADASSDSTTAPSGSIAEVAKQMGAWGGQYQACYLDGGGHGDTADLQKRIDSHFAPMANGVDCSGFTRAVIFQATKKDPGSMNTSSMCADTSKFEHIPKAQAQPGDFSIDCASHVEVITAVNGGKFDTVGSHTTGCGPGFGPSPSTPNGYQGTESFVLRYKG